jgi:hypothetical protein
MVHRASAHRFQLASTRRTTLPGIVPLPAEAFRSLIPSVRRKLSGASSRGRSPFAPPRPKTARTSRSLPRYDAPSRLVRLDDKNRRVTPSPRAPDPSGTRILRPKPSDPSPLRIVGPDSPPSSPAEAFTLDASPKPATSSALPCPRTEALWRFRASVGRALRPPRLSGVLDARWSGSTT